MASNTQVEGPEQAIDILLATLEIHHQRQKVKSAEIQESFRQISRIHCMTTWKHLRNSHPQYRMTQRFMAQLGGGNVPLF